MEAFIPPKRAACLTIYIGYGTEARALILACIVMWHVAFDFKICALW